MSVIADRQAELVTKSDLDRSLAQNKAEILQAIAELRADLKSEIAGVYRQLWVTGIGVIGVTVALLRFIPA